MQQLLLTILKNTLIITSASLFFQLIFSIYLNYKFKNFTPFWWIIPPTSGVLIYKDLLSINTLNYAFFHIILLSVFFGIPFFSHFINIAKCEIESEIEASSLSCNKLETLLFIELPIIINKLKNIIVISFISTWFKINIIVPFNSGGIAYSNSNFETYNWYENISSFNLESGYIVALISFVSCIFFSTIIWGCLSFVNNCNLIYKFNMFLFVNLSKFNNSRENKV